MSTHFTEPVGSHGVSDYTNDLGRSGRRVSGPNGVVLITPRAGRPGAFDAWFSDSLDTLMTGAAGACFARAFKAAGLEL